MVDAGSWRSPLVPVLASPLTRTLSGACQTGTRSGRIRGINLHFSTRNSSNSDQFIRYTLSHSLPSPGSKQERDQSVETDDWRRNVDRASVHVVMVTAGWD
eukprot:769976-Amorphochlora_amoeboformis.AAC.1